MVKEKEIKADDLQSFKISKDVHSELKIYAATKGLRMIDVANKAILKYIQSHKTK